MTSEERALLRAIIHDPEDAPRLVYADWLEEHGDPVRAGLIRRQCRPAGSEAETLSESERKRVIALADSAAQRWQSVVPPHLADYFWPVSHYRRGLLAYLGLQGGTSLDGFLAVGEELFELAPIEEIIVSPAGGEMWVDLPTASEQIRRLCAMPCLARLRLLEFRSPFDDLNAVGRHVAESPHLTGLRRLTFALRYAYSAPDWTGDNYTVEEMGSTTLALLRQTFGDRLVLRE